MPPLPFLNANEKVTYIGTGQLNLPSFISLHLSGQRTDIRSLAPCIGVGAKAQFSFHFTESDHMLQPREDKFQQLLTPLIDVD